MAVSLAKSSIRWEIRWARWAVEALRNPSRIVNKVWLPRVIVAPVDGVGGAWETAANVVTVTTRMTRTPVTRTRYHLRIMCFGSLTIDASEADLSLLPLNILLAAPVPEMVPIILVSPPGKSGYFLAEGGLNRLQHSTVAQPIQQRIQKMQQCSHRRSQPLMQTLRYEPSDSL